MIVERLSFTGRGRLPLIRQSEAAECGLACLAMVASFYGHRIDLNTLRRRFPVSLNGVTLRALIQVASQLRLLGRPLHARPARRRAARREGPVFIGLHGRCRRASPLPAQGPRHPALGYEPLRGAKIRHQKKD